MKIRGDPFCDCLYLYGEMDLKKWEDMTGQKCPCYTEDKCFQYAQISRKK